MATALRAVESTADSRPRPSTLAELVAFFRTRVAALDKKERERFDAFLVAHADDRSLFEAWDDPWTFALGGYLPWDATERLATEMGADPTRARGRVPAAILETLKKLLFDRGHTAYPIAQLHGALGMLLRPAPTPAAVAQALDRMCRAGVIELLMSPHGNPDWNLVQLPELARSEATVARIIRRLLAEPRHVSAATRMRVQTLLATSPLSDEQRKAIWAALSFRFLVVTGPAGTGKSVIISEMNRIFSALGETVLVATPTGLAAEVLQNRNVPQARTCHSLLSLTPDDTHPLEPATRIGAMPFGHRLLGDESTMLDQALMSCMLQAVPEDDGFSVVFFGDVDQLPPVGPGSPYECCVASPDVIPVVRIEKVRRTVGPLTEKGLEIRVGRMPEFDTPEESLARANADPKRLPYEFAFFDTDRLPKEYREQARQMLGKRAADDEVEQQAIALWTVDICCTVLPREFPEWNPATDIQIITPQGPDPLGTVNLSGLIRERLNPLPAGEKDLPWSYGTKLPDGSRPHRVRVGDSVIAINTISEAVKNGAVGEVLRVEEGKDGRVGMIRFPGRSDLLAVKPSDMIHFGLRYALTVNRTQGSQYPAVVQIVHPGTAKTLATRRRLYTGYTRAQKISVIVGKESHIQFCLDNVAGDQRITSLPLRIRGRWGD